MVDRLGKRSHNLRIHEQPRKRLTSGEAPGELVHVEKIGTGRPGEVSIVFPSTSPDRETNLNAFGLHIAEWIRDKVKEAQREKKTPVIDLPTGNTPRSVWPHLSGFVERGALDLSGAVFVGHEAAFGNPTPESPVDYEGSRRKVLKELGVKILEITDPKQVSNGEIRGNYISMNASKGNEGERTSDGSAKIYDQVLHALRGRDDVTFIGFYGVGTDGHIAEIQTNTLTGAAEYDTQHAFAYHITRNSDIRGAVHVEGDTFQVFRNNMWKPDEPENYHGATHLTGPGWEDLLFHDHMVLAFNNESKIFAFQSILEGSVDAIVTNDTQERVMAMRRDPGIGENIYGALKRYAGELVEKRLLREETVDTIDASDDPKKSKHLFREIYASLYANRYILDEDQSHEIFEKMWGYANEYLGKQTPVSVLVRLRTLLGLDTTIVATPEVVQDTDYERLAPMPK